MSDFQPPEVATPGEQPTKNEDVIYDALCALAGVDTYDTNLRNHSKAWDVMEKLAAHIYNEGRKDQQEVDAKLIESLASHIRLGLS